MNKAILLVFLATGCIQSLEDSRVPNADYRTVEQIQTCQDISEKELEWSAVSLGLGTIAGPVTVIGLPGDNVDTKRIYMLSGAVIAATAASFHYIASNYKDQYLEQGCGN